MGWVFGRQKILRRVCFLDVEEEEEEVVVHDSVLNTSAPTTEIGGCRYGPVAGLLRYLCLGFFSEGGGVGGHSQLLTVHSGVGRSDGLLAVVQLGN